MANQIRIKTSVEIVQDVGASAGAQNGITYTSESVRINRSYVWRDHKICMGCLFNQRIYSAI